MVGQLAFVRAHYFNYTNCLVYLQTHVFVFIHIYNTKTIILYFSWRRVYGNLVIATLNISEHQGSVAGVMTKTLFFRTEPINEVA